MSVQSGIKMCCAVATVLLIVSCVGPSASKDFVLHERDLVGAWCSPIQWDWYGYRLVLEETGYGYLVSDYTSPATSAQAVCKLKWTIGPRKQIAFQIIQQDGPIRIEGICARYWGSYIEASIALGGSKRTHRTPFERENGLVERIERLRRYANNIHLTQ